MASDDDQSSILILRSSCSDGAPQAANLPLWCDLAVLPEIHGSNESIIRVLQQGLNPCGIDNVLLLEGLKHGQGYLMSLSNCFTLVEDDDERLPVTSFPSTFFFLLQSTPSIKEDSGIMINTMQSSTELHVTFDVTSDRSSGEEEDESLPPILNGGDNMTACRAPVDIHAEVLRLLETLAEQEARDVDIMLSGLFLVVVVLLGVYGWTVYTLARKVSTVNVSTKKTKIAPRSSRSPPRRSTATFTPTGDADTRRTDPIEPPVDSVIFDCTDIDDVPSLIDAPCGHCSTQDVILGSLPSKVTPSPRQLDSVAKPPVSPCSKLEKDWEQKKAARRSRRRVRLTPSTSFLMPVPVAEESSMGNAFSVQPTKRILPLPECPQQEPTSIDAPLCPTSVSDESFLNDYW